VCAKDPAVAVEEPAFHTVLKDGAFEVRDYPALVVAEVTVTGGQSEAASKGFRLLAGYIFGGNHKKQSIAMTAPVAQARTAEEWVVRFTMPGRYALETLPQPNDPRVRLRQAPPDELAVIRFSGVARPRNVAAKTAELSTWIQSRHLRQSGPAALAQYNPPWTPWFMRRNEVMIPVGR
jgi:hypothetical protein